MSGTNIFGFVIPAQLAMEDVVIMIIFCLAIVLTLIRRYFRPARLNIERVDFSRTIVITGAATGIGKSVVKKLSQFPCIIYILDVDSKTMEKNIAQLNQTKHRQCLIQFIHVDLSSLKSIKVTAELLRSKNEKIDVLINNAGILALPTRKLNDEGIQLQMATNYIGHCRLTFELMDWLRKSKRFRIINVGSCAHKLTGDTFSSVDLNFDDFKYQKQDYKPFLAYSRSKLCLAAFTIVLALEMQIRNTMGKVFYVHPGQARSSIGRYQLTGFRKFLFITIYPLYYYCISRSCDEAADSILYLMFEKYDVLQNGAYYNNNQISNYSTHTKNREFLKKVWQQTLSIVKPLQNWNIQ